MADQVWEGSLMLVCEVPDCLVSWLVQVRRLVMVLRGRMMRLETEW